MTLCFIPESTKRVMFIYRLCIACPTSLPARPVLYPLGIATHATNQTRSADEGTIFHASLQYMNRHASLSLTTDRELFSEGSLSPKLLSIEKKLFHPRMTLPRPRPRVLLIFIVS